MSLSPCSSIKRCGYCLYVGADMCDQLIKTPKGLFLAKKILTCGLTQVQSLIRFRQAECQVLDMLVDQLNMKDPIFTQFFPTFFAWQGLVQALSKAGAGMPEKWEIGRAVLQTAAKTLSLLSYFDKLGAHTIDTLIEWDAKCGGLAARVGKSSLFCMCGMQTVNGLKSRLSILASLCAIAQAVQNYKKARSSPEPYSPQSYSPQPYASDPKTVYAKQILAIQLGKEILKIAANLCVASSPLGTCIGIALLVVNVSKEIFNIYYMGKKSQPPREIPMPRYLIHVQEGN